MTDKQIIIHGVDVSGCEFYTNNGWCCCALVYDDYCKDFPNCVYKLSQQLKRKEQECERLKEEIKKHNDDMFKNPPEKRFYCKGCTLPYISKKLKQTLTEIKEIAENVYCLTNALNRDMALFAKEILQKISECEVE